MPRRTRRPPPSRPKRSVLPPVPPDDPNAFAGASIDRAAERRTDEAWLAAARADARARAIAVGRAGATPERVALRDDDSEPLFLGVEDDGAPLFAVERPEEELLGLREQAASLGAADAGLLAYASGLWHFQRTHRFCGRCGSPMQMREGGHSRRCENGHQVHPRTDPVVITAVHDGPGRILLGRQAVWPKGRYSALAGFVEPGEGLEAAVAREVLEESGVDIAGVSFHSSQPWPFPASLMLGFLADYASGDPHPADGELEDVRWFERDEVAAATSEDIVDWTTTSDHLLLPPRVAIARRLIEAWLELK